ncbi:surface-anchored 5'-nucleotidase [Streptococcus hyovaginalis]|uniref:surface-anchored 5'-nucleotidase n=1 Tax=Streptococcus hyovaginalis TaxID=149015 RepID=UPI002A90C758|nr:5'-nucleotidase C-terminal domain-containing protein [Streptococcus hyovaginalis]MDY5974559.1 5'-nucleotidase C-terminal domain-containing protein [Streptococcus hyovaginalis]
MKKKLILKSSLLAVVAGFGLATSPAFADQEAIQILGINDFHGALDTTGSAYMPDGKVSNAGTAAQLDAYMDDAEAAFIAENPDATSIRVQAGDMVGASPANSGLLKDEPTIKVFNQMDVAYGTIGNHEFDEGLDEYNRIVQGQAPSPEAGYNTIVYDYEHIPATQEIVIANVVDKATGEIPNNWQPYAIKNVPINDKNVQVGFIGIVTKEIPNLVLRQNYEQYDFLDEVETIAAYALELQKKGVKAIVVLAHVPAANDGDTVVGDAADIMNRVNEIFPEHSIDILFAGHSHQYTNGLVGNTRIVQALSQGKAYADVRGILDTDTQDFVVVPGAEVVAVAPGVKTGSKDIQAIVDEANAIVKKVTDTKIGTALSSDTISREVNDFKESPVGNLVTTAQLTIANQTSDIPVDFAMTNNGGIRADLIVTDDGSITWGAAQAVQPFGNILQIVQMSGENIYKVLNEQYDGKENYFLQMSGLYYTYTDNPDGGEEVPFKVVKAYKDNGEEIDPSATYTLVINDFLYGGGDGFASFRNATLVGAINPDTETFIEYISQLEAKGEKITAGINNVKRYLAELPRDEPSPSDTNTGTTTESETGATETTEESVTPASVNAPKVNSQKPLFQTQNIASVQSLGNRKVTNKDTEHYQSKAGNLPETSEHNSATFILTGITILGMAGMVAKRKHD